jgi:hypothetical protein
MTESQMTFSLNDRIEDAARRLAVRFTDEADLPVRFRKQSATVSKPRRVNESSVVEVRFRAQVEIWTNLIENMISKIDPSQAWRFIHVLPEIEEANTRLTENKDFCDFIDYMIRRRDMEGCDSNELGGLALLSVAFQREIEKTLLRTNL